MKRKTMPNTIIIGASGLIGKCLFDNLSKNNLVTGTYYKNEKKGLLYYDLVSSNIFDFGLYKYKYGIICSATTKIKECQEQPEKSREINVLSIERIINDFKEFDVIPVFMSSVTVFGENVFMKKETDERKPNCFYGKQKKEVEDFIIKNVDKHLIIRLGKIIPYNVQSVSERIIKAMEMDLRGIYHINPLEVLDDTKFLKELREV